MTQSHAISGFEHASGDFVSAHTYLLPALEKLLREHTGRKQRLFDLGCGNGSVANYLSDAGYSVVGVDPSVSGIQQANITYPHLDLRIGSAYDNLVDTWGRFPLVYSLEVIEHVYAPREFMRGMRNLVEPGGTVILSTPYHGYWKYLALSLTGKMDAHLSPLWDHGHIKFWSISSLTTLFRESGFVVSKVVRVGRLPALARSMFIVGNLGE